MCGLIGFSGKTNFNKDKISILMLWNAYERGKDATGIYTPKNNLNKNTDVASKFLTTIPFEEDKLLIAHVRAKTIGANVDKNAHPFNEENIVLAHNGTLKNYYGLTHKYSLPPNTYDVDSHIMCAIIAKEKNFNVLSEIDGPAALLIHDKNNSNILYVFRNDERPLYKGIIDGNMYISSISEALEVIGCKNIKEFKKDYLYTIVNGLIQGTAKKIINKPYAHVFNNTSHAIPIPQLLLNTYIKFDTYNNVTAEKLTYNKEYLVIGYDNTDSKVQIKDDSNNEVYVSSFKFDRMHSCILVNSYVKSRVNLTKVLSDDIKQLVIEKDTICLITTDYLNGKVELMNLTTSLKYDVPKKLLIKLTSNELLDYKNPAPSCNIPILLNVNEDIESFPTYDDDETKAWIEDEEQDDQDNSDYYDLQVNEEKLITDLNNIEHDVKHLIDFVSDFIPIENVFEFKEITIGLNKTLYETIDEYSITTNTK